MMYEGGVELIDEPKLIDTVTRVKEDKLWGEIRRAAKTNKTLQSALEECIIIYKLSKEYKNGI
jgi:hypothetical protein